MAGKGISGWLWLRFAVALVIIYVLSLWVVHEGTAAPNLAGKNPQLAALILCLFYWAPYVVTQLIFHRIFGRPYRVWSFAELRRDSRKWWDLGFHAFWAALACCLVFFFIGGR